MKCHPTIGLVAAVVLTLSCSEKREIVSKVDACPDFYRTQSACTDPGELGVLYDEIPTVYDALCAVIKTQLIHPLEVGPHRDVIPQEREFEDTVYLSVHSMLSDLLAYDSAGLARTRAPQDRLVVACLHHSLLLASILRERGIPVRIRFGFAPYIGRMVGMDVAISHVVCEVWDDEESRWVYIDPDREMIDFPAGEFITGAEAWRDWRQGRLETGKFRSAFFTEEQSLLDMLRLDLLYALREEIMYWGDSGPPQVPAIAGLSQHEMESLDQIAALLRHAGSNHEELSRLRDQVAFLR